MEEDLIWKFSEEVVDFVLEDRGFQCRPDLFHTENLSKPFNPNVGKVVIGLIKGDLKPVFLKTTINMLLKAESLEDIERVLKNFPEIFFQIYPFSYLNLLKGISYIVMHSLFYDEPDPAYTIHLAYKGIACLLKTANDGKFVQENGFKNLTIYSKYLIGCDKDLEAAYKSGSYPW